MTLHVRLLYVYRQTLMLHILQVVLSILLAIMFYIFMLRPFLAETSSETKRVAELLAQLPADIDVEGLVQKALLPSKGSAANGKGGSCMQCSLPCTVHCVGLVQQQAVIIQVPRQRLAQDG